MRGVSHFCIWILLSLKDTMKVIGENFKVLYQALTDCVLKGKGYSTPQDRKAAFDNENVQQPLQSLIEKVAHQAFKITDQDIEKPKRAGFSEDQLFELIVCAAVGQASRQYDSGLAALAEAKKEKG